MKLLPVALAIFYRKLPNALQVWVQTREDDGPYQGLWEFPGGKIEAGEEPLVAAIREVREEVGIDIQARDAKFMGIYPHSGDTKTILLYVFLFPEYPALMKQGQWLDIEKNELSGKFSGKSPPPNHQIIDELYHSLYDGIHE